jgi:hypothetical protein
MANIRTANTRHNRAITQSNTRRKAAAAPVSPSAKPKKALR